MPRRHAYDVFACPVEGCPWSCAWPCFGSCLLAPVLLTVPVEALEAIGAHSEWHERDDVRAGLVVVVWDDAAEDFVEVAGARPS